MELTEIKKQIKRPKMDFLQLQISMSDFLFSRLDRNSKNVFRQDSFVLDIESLWEKMHNIEIPGKELQFTFKLVFLKILDDI